LWLHFVSSHFDAQRAGASRWIVQRNGDLNVQTRSMSELACLRDSLKKMKDIGHLPEGIL
jgi:hypothetical protein